MRAFLARLLRSLTSTTLSAQLAGMLIGGILFLHGVATFTVQLVEERQAARSALLEQANSLALSLQLLHSEPFEYKRSLLERLERLDVVHLSLSDAPNPARQARDERALYLRDRLRKNLNSIETDLDTREMLTEVQRVHVADSMNPTLRRHVPWTHVYESRVSVRLDDGKWLCVVISSDAYGFSPSQASLTMLLLEAGLLILLILWCGPCGCSPARPRVSASTSTPPPCPKTGPPKCARPPGPSTRCRSASAPVWASTNASWPPWPTTCAPP